MPSPSEPKSRRRRLPKWLKVTIVTMLAVANLAALGLLWAIKTGQDFLGDANTDRDVVDVLDPAGGESLTFLIVGSDSREGLDDLTNFGVAGGERGDVIMLLRLDTTTSTAKILSIPRDLWVNVPGQGEAKINAAYAFGGPRLMVQTIKENLGIEVNHYVEVGFVGFMGLVDDLGGVELDFPYPARDLKSGLAVEAGRQKVDGMIALAYARSRTYQEWRNGSWVAVDANDIGRTQRQQEVVRAILRAMAAPSSVAEAGTIATGLSRHVTIDARLAGSSVARLAWDYKWLLSGDIDGVTLPVTGATRGDQSVVLRQEPEATEVLEEFRAGTLAIDRPLRIQVLNGNGVSGSAAAMASDLEGLGYQVLAIGDAESKDYTTTTVVVPAGSAAGPAVVADLGFGTMVTGEVPAGYDAVVIVGADYSP